MSISTHPDIQGKTVFVTGGTGFVGSHLVERLLELGCEVRCLVRKDPKWLKDLPVTFIMGTLHDEPALRSGIEEAQFVFHVAGRTRGRNREEFTKDNVEGTENLLRLGVTASSLERILITSSLAAIGEAESQIANESTPMRPVSEYGRSKAEMERMIQGYSDRVPTTVIRPPAVYGPRETDIFTFFQTVSKGFCPIVGSSGKEALSLVHVNDLVQGCLLAAANPSSESMTYFVGSERQYSWGEIRDHTTSALDRRALTLVIPKVALPIVGFVSEMMGRMMGSYPPLNREKAREISRATLMCDSELAMRQLGYRPSMGLDEGIRTTMEWYRTEGWI